MGKALVDIYLIKKFFWVQLRLNTLNFLILIIILLCYVNNRLE